MNSPKGFFGMYKGILDYIKIYQYLGYKMQIKSIKMCKRVDIKSSYINNFRVTIL